MSRYTVSDERAWSRVVRWRIRASLTDESTGDSVEFSSRPMADEAAELLERATHGERPPKPQDAAPFAAYDISQGDDGWIYIWYGDGALSHKAVGRSRSEALARQAAELLSLANASGHAETGAARSRAPSDLRETAHSTGPVFRNDPGPG